MDPAACAMDDFIDLMTYTCPFTGRKRCAISAALECSQPPPKRSSIQEEAW